MDHISEGARKRQKLILTRKALLSLEKAAGPEWAAQRLRRRPDRLSCHPKVEEDPVALSFPIS